MNKNLMLVIMCLAVFCVSATAEEGASASIEGLLLSIRENTHVPAYSVAIVRGGRLIAASAVGEIDIVNHIDASPENWFRLASVSKVIGATMLALLVQDGDLDPNKAIGVYLPDLPSQYRNMTALQLLSHTSGMPHYQARDALRGNTHYNSAIDALASVGDRQLLSTPGDSYSYSSHGYTILSALYEAITGVPLRVAVPAFIRDLTGRDSPALENLQQRFPLRSNVFDVVTDGAVTLKPHDQSYTPFGTGFVASATDLAFFGDALLHSGSISSETRDLLFQPVVLTDGGKTGNHLYEVAFGWRVGRDSSGRTVYHHAGVTSGARSVLVLYPESNLSIAFLSNASWTAQIERTAFALANLVIESQRSVSSVGDFAFTGSFDGEDITGSIVCPGETGECLFSDNLSDDRGAFSEWLARYLPGDEAVGSWPVLSVYGVDGYAQKIATSIGIVELRLNTEESDDKVFRAEVGNGRLLEIRFSEVSP